MKKLFPLFSILLTFGLLVAACGSDAADSDTNPITVITPDAPVDDSAAEEENAKATLVTLTSAAMPFDNAEFSSCIVDSLKDAHGGSYSDLLTHVASEDDSSDAAFEAASLSCMSQLSVDELQMLGSMDDSSDEYGDDAISGEKAFSEYTADELMEIESMYTASINWDVTPYVVGDQPSMHNAGDEFSLMLEAKNFTAAPILAVPCPQKSAAEMIVTGGDGCDLSQIVPFDAENKAMITGTATGEGMCWGIGDIAQTETSFFCSVPYHEVLK